MTDVTVRELVGWGFDESPYRPKLAAISQTVTRAAAIAGQRPHYTQYDPILHPHPTDAATALSEVIHRTDLHAEMTGLQWTTGVVDLRRLLAFQRRLLLDDTHAQPTIPLSNDWPALTVLTFGPPATPTCNLLLTNDNHATLQSPNPNLQLRFTASSTAPTLQFHAGSPFFEVAEYQSRWFLRDGYHRAYYLLQAKITHVPAVIIRATTLTDLGPIHPWFFSSDVLFGPHPPRLIDFLEPDLTVEYKRPRLYKTLRVTIEESLEPIFQQATQGATP
jgi:hypothetical protein